MTKLTKNGTEQQRSQEIQIIFDALPVMIWYKDRSNKILRCNRLAASTRGVTVAEMENRYTHEFYPDEAEMYFADDLEVINTGQPKSGIIEQHLIANGEKIWVCTDKLPYYDKQGNIIGVIVFALDITKLKQTEEELAHSLSMLHAALESTADGLMVVNRHGKIIKFNRKFQMMWQLSYDDLLNQNSEILNFMLSQLNDPDELKKRILELNYQSEAESFDTVEFIDGRIFECYSQPQRINEKTIGRVWSFRDVTERKQAEAQLNNTTEQLRRLYTHLQFLREQERSNIAREIHDELGQNLTALSLGISWLQNRIPPVDPKVVEKAAVISQLVDTIIKSVQRISTELRPSVLDNLGLIAAIEWQVQEFTNHTGIKVQLKKQINNISIDQARMTAIFRVFQEALTNIARHAEATDVKIQLKEKNNFLIIEIKDNGRGISQHQITAVTSLGLIGMRERIMGLGGLVSINGMAGKGTTVRLQMPTNK